MAPEGISYSDMNRLAAQAPVGSAGVSILPFGNGAERMLENKETGCSICGVNFNLHGKQHIVRAAQEGSCSRLNTALISWSRWYPCTEDSCRTCQYVSQSYLPRNVGGSDRGCNRTV